MSRAVKLNLQKNRIFDRPVGVLGGQSQLIFQKNTALGSPKLDTKPLCVFLFCLGCFGLGFCWLVRNTNIFSSSCVTALFINPEVALRLPTTYDNRSHPIRPAVSSRFFDPLNSLTYDLKRSKDLRWLFDLVLHSSLDDLVINSWELRLTLV